MNNKRLAMFPGVFDPFTVGHQSLVNRTLKFADEVIIAIGHNLHKNTYFPVDVRYNSIKELFKNEPRVKVHVYSSLTVDFAAASKVDFIVRGVRSLIDFEYEKNLAEINRKLAGIETVILFTEPEISYISSTLVRELFENNADISNFVPKETLKFLVK
ncbi:MAG: pantetheine-phosphate adenylyltransferase [Tannerella sp.]|jgi:pantetheine-phosphate adenylyltransferase|nr:pantetheine-phosphate adenylyltransferase [Tannerella sp.]